MFAKTRLSLVLPCVVAALLVVAVPVAGQTPAPAASEMPSGVIGSLDQVRAATLVVPYFRVGIDSAANPDDTLLVVTNRSETPQRIHYEVWDVNGIPAALFGDVLLPANGSEPLSMRALITAADAAVGSDLTLGDFYQGFVTIDATTANTELLPLDDEYPFSNRNALTGWMYYTRLTAGSSNGLPMLHLEHVGSDVEGLLRDFYLPDHDGREEMDLSARLCAAGRTRQLAADPFGACEDFAADTLSEMHFRLFLGAELNGESRVIVFTWVPGLIGGPTILCADEGCPTTYAVGAGNEAGDTADITDIELPGVVNVLDIAGSDSGFLTIRDLPDVFADLQIYGFSFNSARPDSAGLNWDAIFEATIIP